MTVWTPPHWTPEMRRTFSEWVDAELARDEALAAAARKGGDVKQAPAESPQSGGAKQRNAQPLPPKSIAG
jgi:hypothetical protein